MEIGDTFLSFDQLFKGNHENYLIWEFFPTPIISSYLYAIIAGPFKQIKSLIYNNVEMSIYCRESLY